MTAEKAVTEVRASILPEVSKFINEIGKDFEWPENFPVSIGIKQTLDCNAAIEAVELSGIDTDKLYIPSSSDEVDINKLLEKYKSMGGEIDSSVLKTRLDEERLIQALKDAGLSETDFYVGSTPTIKMSQKMANLDQKEALKIEVFESISALVEEKAQEELLQIESIQAQLSNQNSLSMSN